MSVDLFLDFSFFPQLVGSGSMDCGMGIQNCILMEIWFTQLVLVTIRRIGFMHRLQGLIFVLLIVCIIWLKIIMQACYSWIS